MNAKTAATAAGTAVAIVAVIVCLILVLTYRGQVNSYRTQLVTTRGQISTVDQQLSQVQSEEQQAAKTAASANSARLGICWSPTVDTTTGDMLAIQINSPVEQNGVYQCPSGMSFVSVVPSAG